MIAVIIPVYNRKNLLKNALDSLVSQSFKRFITVIVDDASTEDLKEIVDDFRKKLQICYIRKLKNEGPGLARQSGLEWCYDRKIDFVTFLDADDMLYPTAIERLGYEINHTMGDLVASQIMQNTNKIDELIEANNTTWTHGKIYRTSFLKKRGIRFSNTLKTNEDLAFNLKVTCLVSENKYFMVEEPLYLWRRNESSLTKETQSLQKIIGADYIEAIYETALSMPNEKKLIKDIFNCYNYYQIMLVRDKEVPTEVNKKIKYLLNKKDIKEVLSDDKKMEKYAGVIKPGMEFQGKMYWFEYSFIQWIRMFMEE